MTDRKSNGTKVILIIGALLAVLAIGIISTMKPGDKSGVAPTETQTAAEAPQAATDTATVDVASALSDRVLGDTNAPMKIVEYASFTCSHCGDFHRHTFDQLKTNQIDTGKAYMVFMDFPLNQPAMDASKVSRCVAKEKYFDFMGVLFKEQDAWITSPDYKSWLKTKAGEYGLSEAQADACLNSTEIEAGIKDWMKVAQEQWQVSSTPSFIINNKTTVAGAYQYDAFAELLTQEAAKEASGEAAPPPANQPIENPSPEAAPNAGAPAAPSAEEPANEVTPAQTETPDQATPQE